MKKTYLRVAVILTLTACLMSTSCIGSFSLTKKLMDWNQTVSNKFVNELIFFAFWFLPVYEVTAIADVIVLNSIEFWSGSNPVEASTRVIDGKDGRYFVECDGKGYTITAENDGSVVRLDFDADDNSWNVATDEGSVKLMTFVDDSHVRMLNADGSYSLVELSEQGCLAYQAQNGANSLFAAK